MDLPTPIAATLAALRTEHERTTRALAVACQCSGTFDAHQIEAFDLAWASADLLAAEVGGDALFAVEAAEAIIQRLDALARALDLDPAPLRTIRDDLAWREAQSAIAGPAALAAYGERVLAGADDDLTIDDDAAMARDSFARFARDQITPHATAIHRGDVTLPETILTPLRAMGAFGLSVPTAYGGSADEETQAAVTMVAVTEALSEASLVAGSLITRPEILGRALLAGGTDAQKATWLPRIAAGDPLCAIAITEPDYGSDVAALQLRATCSHGGWLLNGAKTWCTFAGKAGLLMVVARTDPDHSRGHRGLSLLMVEKPSDDGHAFAHDQPGGGRLTGTAIPTIGYRGMHSFDLSFTDWFVPAENLIGEEAGVGRGFYLTMAGMTGGRLQTAARASGVMRAAIGAAVDHANTRRVFGATLGEYPLTRAKLARMAARAAACRRLAYAVASGRHPGSQAEAASLVKLIACRSAEIVTREALQIHGGMGYAEESIVSRLFVDARVLSIFEGAEETLALKVIARGLLAAVDTPA